ncbi:F-box only protein 28 isoform X1 [Cotesia glomerata]|uniref:F-box domain-containing protein n=2 Tax=Cotesia glomerata TaxID=32391 RepID=A0AAV7IYK5_COTGL|nr:F-box only protein 28 isoform X1 [Cotesia glomerata]XP_044584161.1 F-box only protein 28 isoform X1 [Cotesia glomerata]XP_044584163.1 F-box only protein 28 isoform X1 [Cotesia glomerata]XP_044584164.1 F-box only protein 28 isoform X1 [Cotesia glomerata]XP_044584165.1 F-box only protein 28 isoform X1 [Cotesia glomerata]XP_044584166.1 F-box only protein 28 isoform X1 [Cotesia glomerata]XP_044584167.1 F-box only protein 28 isoform X1 [Cotesia glomerata]XP_044584168.1 F-box only protein 28 is
MVSTRQSSNMGSKVTDTSEPGPPRKHSPNAGASSLPEPAPSRNLNLLDLPPEIFEKIASYLDYNTIANIRPVCHQMNSMCGAILSSSFQRILGQMLSRFHGIKARMPRRESARRNHPLSCESDIIETVHMRLTLLQMTLGKHIERKHCCFFPGLILDEVNRVLHYIKVTPKLVKPYKVTDELFDLSSMAMEFFKEQIEPTLPEIACFSDFLDIAGTFSTSSSVNKPFLCLDTLPLVDNSDCSSSSVECSSRPSVHDEPELVEINTPPQSNMVLRKRIRRIKLNMKKYNTQLVRMQRNLNLCKTKIAEQQKQILEYANRLDDNDKKNEETSRKFSTLLQVFTKELNKCKTELQYWRSKSPAIPVCNGCGQSMPMPAEDLQALANQSASVLAESFAEPLNFIPIAFDSPTESTQEQLTPQMSVMAPPKAPLSVPTKRKVSIDDAASDATKKSRRTVKSRHAKRNKI